MKLLRRLDNPRLGSAGCVVTIGSFDGIHIGHQALIGRARSLAREGGCASMVLSFEPLPREFLRPADPPARLSDFRERWRLIEALGVDCFCVLPFGAALSRVSGRDFMDMLGAAGARCIVVGHDFRFGRGGEADVAWCTAHAAAFGLVVEIVPPVQVDGERASSGRVREALAAGDFRRAARLLGRPYAMCGRVRRGQELGRRLGFATANIAMRRRALPFAGILAVRVSGAGLAGWPGVASLGTRPTVNGVEPLLEVHLFDYAGDLYGRELEVEFVAKLREELRFESLDTLVEQMHRDAAAARHTLAVTNA
ncbi:MAG: bifunctional riboflavin kinase/FAD synthetase [Gammaproteobacteria bacterium]|nr:bifunctional riboflavin kinase/FAD synthetase [Gammaproteobacteria bacterium]